MARRCAPPVAARRWPGRAPVEPGPRGSTGTQPAIGSDPTRPMQDPVVVEIRLFGGVGATGTRGDAVDIGPAKCQAVLAALALSPGAAVPVPRLIEVVWGQVPPRTAGKTLQSYVTRLRKGLGPDAIVRTGAAYRLDIDPEGVDV